MAPRSVSTSERQRPRLVARRLGAGAASPCAAVAAGASAAPRRPRSRPPRRRCAPCASRRRARTSTPAPLRLASSCWSPSGSSPVDRQPRERAGHPPADAAAELHALHRALAVAPEHDQRLQRVVEVPGGDRQRGAVAGPGPPSARSSRRPSRRAAGCGAAARRPAPRWSWGCTRRTATRAGRPHGATRAIEWTIPGADSQGRRRFRGRAAPARSSGPPSRRRQASCCCHPERSEGPHS